MTPLRSRWEMLGLGLLAILVVVVMARIAFQAHPERQNVYLKVFAPAGTAFVEGHDLYLPGSGFRYPPIAAALFWPFTWFGPVLGSLVWRLAMLAVLLLGLRAVRRAEFPFALSSRERGVLLLVLVATLVVSFNNGQPNVLILGLLLLAAAGDRAAAVRGPAAAVAGCAAIKVYPAAYGFVLGALRPRLLPWLLGALALAAALPFALQSSHYVAAQYGALYDVLRTENRTLDLGDAYRDLRLLSAAAGLPMSALVFLALQVACGGAIVVLCHGLRRAGVAAVRVSEYAFSLTACWFMLLGPATEKATYTLIGPTLAWGLIAAWRRPGRLQRAAWLLASVLVVADHALPPASREFQGAHPWYRCLLPLSALIATLALLHRATGDGASARASRPRDSR